MYIYICINISIEFVYPNDVLKSSLPNLQVFKELISQTTFLKNVFYHDSVLRSLSKESRGFGVIAQQLRIPGIQD